MNIKVKSINKNDKIQTNNNQKTYQGGSGCGCSAVVLNSYVMQKMREGVYKKVLFGK